MSLNGLLLQEVSDDGAPNLQVRAAFYRRQHRYRILVDDQVIDRPPGGLARRRSDALSSLSAGRQRRFGRLDKDYRSLPERAGLDNPTRAAASCSVMGGRPVAAGAAEPAEPSAVRQINARRRSFPTRHGRIRCPTVAPTAAARAGSIVLLKDSGAVGNFNREIPSHCEIRDLDIPDPFYTYCANHPCHRPGRDPIPIGPVYVYRATGPSGEGGREEWQPSPDTEEIRQHLLDIVRLPEEHADEGYHFYTRPAHIEALTKLLEWRERETRSSAGRDCTAPGSGARSRRHRGDHKACSRAAGDLSRRPGRPCAIPCLRPVPRSAPELEQDTESVGAGPYCTTG